MIIRNDKICAEIDLHGAELTSLEPGKSTAFSYRITAV